MTDKLKECPFCGGVLRIASDRIDDDHGAMFVYVYFVICNKCGMESKKFLTEKEAEEYANTRPESAEIESWKRRFVLLNRELETLRKEKEGLEKELKQVRGVVKHVRDDMQCVTNWAYVPGGNCYLNVINKLYIWIKKLTGEKGER